MPSRINEAVRQSISFSSRNGDTGLFTISWGIRNHFNRVSPHLGIENSLKKSNLELKISNKIYSLLFFFTTSTTNFLHHWSDYLRLFIENGYFYVRFEIFGIRRSKNVFIIYNCIYYFYFLYFHMIIKQRTLTY